MNKLVTYYMDELLRNAAFGHQYGLVRTGLYLARELLKEENKDVSKFEKEILRFEKLTGDEHWQDKDVQMCALDIIDVFRDIVDN